MSKTQYRTDGARQNVLLAFKHLGQADEQLSLAAAGFVAGRAHDEALALRSALRAVKGSVSALHWRLIEAGADEPQATPSPKAGRAAA